MLGAWDKLKYKRAITVVSRFLLCVFLSSLYSCFDYREELNFNEDGSLDYFGKWKIDEKFFQVFFNKIKDENTLRAELAKILARDKNGKPIAAGDKINPNKILVKSIGIKSIDKGGESFKEIALALRFENEAEFRDNFLPKFKIGGDVYMLGSYEIEQKKAGKTRRVRRFYFPKSEFGAAKKLGEKIDKNRKRRIAEKKAREDKSAKLVELDVKNTRSKKVSVNDGRVELLVRAERGFQDGKIAEHNGELDGNELRWKQNFNDKGAMGKDGVYYWVVTSEKASVFGLILLTVILILCVFAVYYIFRNCKVL